MATKNYFLFPSFFAYYFLKVHLNYFFFSKIKVIKKSQNKTVEI